MKCNCFSKVLKGRASSIAVGILLTSAAVASAQPTGFVTRQDDAEVVIVNLSKGSVLGTIPTLDTSPFEIALSPDASTVYVTHAGRGEDAVNILDVATASPLQRVGVGSIPIEMAFLPNGSKLYTADFLGGTVSVVDTATRARVATIPTAFLSYDVAAAPDGTRVYATSLLATDLFVIDTALDAVVDRIPIGRDFLGHVAITPDGRKAYVTEFRNQVTVIDLASRTVIGSIPFNAAGANPNNGALDIAIDRQGALAYVLGFDTVNVIDLTTDTPVAAVPIGIQLSDVVIDSNGAFVYVTTLHESAPLTPFNEIVKIDTNGFAIRDRFVIGGLLIGLAVGPSAIQVAIDIKPGGNPNSINSNSHGVIAVAILTTDTFDATTVDPTTVLFGPTGTEAFPVHSALEDVDLDGNTDMVLHFNTQVTGIQCGDTSTSLRGRTLSGEMIQGSDSVNTVECKWKPYEVGHLAAADYKRQRDPPQAATARAAQQADEAASRPGEQTRRAALRVCRTRLKPCDFSPRERVQRGAMRRAPYVPQLYSFKFCFRQSHIALPASVLHNTNNWDESSR